MASLKLAPKSVKTKQQTRILQDIVYLIGQKPSYCWTTPSGRYGVRFGEVRKFERLEDGTVDDKVVLHKRTWAERETNLQVGVALDYAEEHGCELWMGGRNKSKDNTIVIYLPADEG